MGKVLNAPEINVSNLPDKLFTVEPKQEDYDRFLNQLLQPFVTIQTVGESAEGDIIRLKLENTDEGTVSEVPFHLAKPFYSKEMIDALSGRKTGERFPFSFRETSYNAEVLSVKRCVQAELTDELAAKIAFEGTKTAGELKKLLHEQVIEGARQERLQSVIGAVKSQLMKNTEFEIPEEEIGGEVKRLKDQLSEMMPEEEQEAYLLDHFKLTDPQKIPEEIRSMASRNIRNRLLSSYYGKGADVSDAAYEARVREFMESGMDEDEVRSRYPKAAFIEDACYDEFIRIIENCCSERWQIHDSINE